MAWQLIVLDTVTTEPGLMVLIRLKWRYTIFISSNDVTWPNNRKALWLSKWEPLTLSSTVSSFVVVGVVEVLWICNATQQVNDKKFSHPLYSLNITYENSVKVRMTHFKVSVVLFSVSFFPEYFFWNTSVCSVFFIVLCRLFNFCFVCYFFFSRCI